MKDYYFQDDRRTESARLALEEAASMQVGTIYSALGVAVDKRATCAGDQVVSNAACCAWFPVLEDIQQNLFHGGQCGAEAHESLRLVFHDSIAISPALEAQGKFG